MVFWLHQEEESKRHSPQSRSDKQRDIYINKMNLFFKISDLAENKFEIEISNQGIHKK